MRLLLVLALLITACSSKAEAPAQDALAETSDISLAADATELSADASVAAK